MIRPKKECARCGSSMQPGVIIDVMHKDAFGGEAAFQQQWIMISPEEISKGRWVGALKNLEGRERRDIVTYCCQNCGNLQSFAEASS